MLYVFKRITSVRFTAFNHIMLSTCVITVTVTAIKVSCVPKALGNESARVNTAKCRVCRAVTSELYCRSAEVF